LRSYKPYAYTDEDVQLAERIGNQIAGAIANAQLFLKQKQTEEALRESEERLRLIAENARVVIWMMDMNLHYRYISPYIKHNLDYTSEEYVLKPLHEVLTPSSLELCLQLFAEELAEEKNPDRDLYVQGPSKWSIFTGMGGSSGGNSYDLYQGCSEECRGHPRNNP